LVLVTLLSGRKNAIPVSILSVYRQPNSCRSSALAARLADCLCRSNNWAFPYSHICLSGQ